MGHVFLLFFIIPLSHQFQGGSLLAPDGVLSHSHLAVLKGVTLNELSTWSDIFISSSIGMGNMRA